MIMDCNEYQKQARKTAIYPSLGNNLYYPVLGLCGEAGEVAEKVKKIIRDRDGHLSEESRAAIAVELGDVLWYIANAASELGLSLNEIAKENLRKLSSRKKRKVLKGSGDDR
jgi:NTP pyrophosphatase (non-canonical NTP hydrolase)